MATRSKEEDLLLDQKIAQIRKKNEEILKRAKEVEEDKKLAMEQNALVQLRPANVDDSRERTPALRPSSREFNKGTSEIGDFPEANSRHPETASFRGRGARGSYNRDRNDRKDGPPPDPRSFLADSERDPPASRDGRGKTFTRGDEPQRGNREFQRGGKRGGERGRGGRGDRMYQRETREDAWRAERLRIDEARIQRQKTADGKWRREWDSDKIHEELNDDARVGRGRGDARPVEQWKHSTHANSTPHTNFDYTHGRGGSFRGSRGGRGGNSYYSDRGIVADGSFGHDMQRSHNNTPGSNDFDNFRGRGGGRSVSHNKNSSPVLRRTVPNSPTSSRNDKSVQDVDDKEIIVDSSKGMQHRYVKNVGDSLEVSISNVQDERHNDRYAKERRHGGRFSRQGKNSRSSYSSQSEDEMPKDKGFSKTKRDRIHFQNKQSHLVSSHMTDMKAECVPNENLEEKVHSGEVEDNNIQSSDKDIEGSEELSSIEDFGINIPMNQNPLPPFKTTPEVLNKLEESDSCEPELTEGDNNETASDIKSSCTDNNVQTLEYNLEQNATKPDIVMLSENNLSSDKNNIESKDSNNKVSNTVNNGTVKETVECDQKNSVPVGSCNKSVDAEQSNVTMENSTMDVNSKKANIEITEESIKNEQVDVTEAQENKVKTEYPVTTEKVNREDIIFENKSEEKVSSADPAGRNTDTSQINTENKEPFSENKQNTVNITETVTANENAKSAE